MLRGVSLIWTRPANALALAAGLLAAAWVAAPGAAVAQVVVMVNGSPITALDIEQRSKFTRLSSQKSPSRQEVLNELIDEKLKVFIAKRYGLEVGNNEVDAAFTNMARRGRMTPQQMEQQLAQSGISAGTLKAKIRADSAWMQLVRGKFGSTLQVGERDISAALESREGGADTAGVGFIYTLYPVLVFVPRDSPPAVVDGKRKEAESLRGRFQSCDEGLRLARGVRDVAVREAISRSSADLAKELREILANTPVGRLTTPETTAQGFQMFAVCDKKQSAADAPIKSEIRQELFSKRFDAESKKFLDEVRRSAMIEYR